MLKKSIASTVLATLLASSLPAQAAVHARPPQFVAFAFDGSKSLPFWKESRDFAKALKAEGKSLKYTYFISGVYFLHSGNKSTYNAPAGGPGKSAIGFSESRAAIGPRLEQVNAVFRDGHEVASHANGHFDGSSWSYDQWNSEFSQFTKIIFGAYQINELPFSPYFPTGNIFKQKDVNGFRAPQLGVSTGLWKALENHNFKYDTSKVATMNYWPEKLKSPLGKGYWNFPLARIQIAGTAKSTLSMDYNFFVSQSGGREDAANSAKYEQQMYESYMRYFQSNYNGNRAPIHIGHHFSKWNGGAYWRAMKRFASTICGMPEVNCGTYQELMGYMESLPPATLAAYRKGNFDRSAVQANFAYELPAPMSVDFDISTRGSTAVAAIGGADAQDLISRGATVEWRWNGIPVAEGGTEFDLTQLPIPSTGSSGITLQSVGSQMSAVFKLGGEEIATATRAVGRADRVGYVFSKESLEAMALTGDLPEAHHEHGSEE